MNKEQTYHIDTTDEEDNLFVDQPTEKKQLFTLPKISMSFPKIFCVVLGAHLLIALLLFGTTLKVSAKEEDKKLLNDPTSAPLPIASTSPTPNTVVQEPVIKTTGNFTQNSSIVTPLPFTKASKYRSNHIEHYVVKQGDTFHKIVKKFKLDAKKLQQLNNIKDTSKIAVGQTLKFL